MSSYEVIAVRYGIARSTREDLFYRYSAYGEPDGPQEMDFFFYVLRNAERTVLVDTGFDLLEAEARPGRAVVVSPLEALDRLGVDRASIADIIVTHLHWDHIGNLVHFPAANLHVARRELDFWASPMARAEQFWPHTDAGALTALLEAQESGRVHPWGASASPFPGIGTTVVGGHSAGQQIVVVTTAGGTVALASDAVHLYEERELRRPFSVITNLPEMYAAYDLLDELERAGATVVPGHDPEVARRFPEIAGVGVRIA